MCGIVGFLDRTENEQVRGGLIILKMLNALCQRGPDSAGVALYGNAHTGHLVLRVKLGDNGSFAETGRRIADQVQTVGTLHDVSIRNEYLRLVIEPSISAQKIEQLVEAVDTGAEVVSMGHQLEIVKQVGSPQNLDTSYGVSKLTGTHGIGHTRLSTESRTDLSHSQPFWAHNYLDLAIVHNGHITNYHKLRRQYEQHGVKFYTENDSEIIGVYLAERLSQGMPLADALQASLFDLDGSFSYLAATADVLGFAKDPFALKPLLFAETDAFVAIANEEIAIRAAFEGSYEVREAQAGAVRTWSR